MTAPMPSPVVLVRLRESTVALLMAQRQGDNETLDAVSARLAHDRLLADGMPTIGIPPLPAPQKVTKARQHRESKYGLELFAAETLPAATLPELFGALIDRLAELDPEAVEKVAAMRSRIRTFVSREKNAIHPGRPDLSIRRTQSGWWISANTGRRDLKRALKATCMANGLVYGRDIRFLAH